MTNTSFIAAAATTDAPALSATQLWAEVRSSDRVMRYRRSGTGPTLLLLSPDATPSIMPADVIDALGARYRVIVPELSTGSNTTEWLAEFLEGLGTCEIAILALHELCIPAIELALRGVEQITRIVLLPDGEADDSTSEGALRTAVGAGPIPLLIVRPGLERNVMLEVVTKFLDDA